jgi:hypothetical protein
MNIESNASNPSCIDCGGSSVRAVRARSVTAGKKRVFYLVHLWTCVICGDQWIDNPLDRRNENAARGALAMARGKAAAENTGGNQPKRPVM